MLPFWVLFMLRSSFDFELLVMYSHALLCLCRPSSLDAIFLAHALVVLQALPVSYIININHAMILTYNSLKIV